MLFNEIHVITYSNQETSIVVTIDVGDGNSLLLSNTSSMKIIKVTFLFTLMTLFFILITKPHIFF